MGEVKYPAGGGNLLCGFIHAGLLITGGGGDIFILIIVILSASKL